MSNKLQETRSLINMARRLGQEPAPELLEQLARLETEANRKLQLESRIKNRVAQDVVKMFNPNHPVPAAITIPASKPAPVVQLQEQMAVVQPIEIKDVAAQVADSIQRQVRNEGTLVRPDAQMPADTAALDQKVKYLENWISRIAATGPGGGEVNLRYLDDVARSTIADGKFLRFNAALKKFDFATVTDSSAPLAVNAPYTSIGYQSAITVTANTNIRILCTGNLTLTQPGAAADGTTVRAWITASSTSITMSLNASIRIPNTSTFTSPQTIATGEKARLAIQYDSVRAVWELVSFVNGY